MSLTAGLPPGDGSQVVALREPFYRIDTVGIKNKLTTLLSAQAAQYWATLTCFLLGKLRRDEFEGLIVEFLNTAVKRHLHNQLLTALLHNASSPLPIGVTPTLSTDPAIQAKTNLSLAAQSTARLKRARGEDGEYDSDDGLDVVPSRQRVRRWVLGMSKGQREQLKGLHQQHAQALLAPEEEEDNVVEMSEMVRGWQGRLRVSTNAKKKHLKAMGSITIKPVYQSYRGLPLDEHLQERVVIMAKEHGLIEGADEEIGQFLSMAIQSHLDTLLRSTHELMRRPDGAAAKTASPEGKTDSESRLLTARRSSTSASEGTDPTDVSDTLRTPRDSPEQKPMDGDLGGDSERPPSDSPTRTNQIGLAQMEALFDVVPHVHPHAGSSVFKLRSGLLRFDEEESLRAQELQKTREDRWDDDEPGMQEVHLGDRSQAAQAGANMAPPPTPRSAKIARPGPGGIIQRPKARREITNDRASHAETMVQELGARGLLKLADRGPLQGQVSAGGKGAGDADGHKDHHELHWSYVDPAVILRDILG